MNKPTNTKPDAKPSDAKTDAAPNSFDNNVNQPGQGVTASQGTLTTAPEAPHAPVAGSVPAGTTPSPQDASMLGQATRAAQHLADQERIDTSGQEFLIVGGKNSQDEISFSGAFNGLEQQEIAPNTWLVKGHKGSDQELMARVQSGFRGTVYVCPVDKGLEKMSAAERQALAIQKRQELQTKSA